MKKLKINSLLYKELFSWAKKLFAFAFELFSNDYEKPISKKLLRPITTEANSAMNQSAEFLTISCNLLKAREKSRVQSAIGLVEKLARDF